MHTDEVVERSPIRELERASHGGPRAGELAALLARSGVGKTACLVQVGLDALLRNAAILHISTETPVTHLRSFYDELFHEIAKASGLENASEVLLQLERRRLLMVQNSIETSRLANALELASSVLGESPQLIMLEGFDLRSASEADLVELRRLAAANEACLWLSVRTHREEIDQSRQGIPASLEPFGALLDLVFSLEASGQAIHLKVLKDRDSQEPLPAPLVLDAVTLQLVEGGQRMQRKGRRERFVLHTGGARGAEAAFGTMAERYGIREVVFTFDGHTNCVRSKGLRVLSETDLQQGNVSLQYVSHRLGRRFPQPPRVRKVIQSIWHLVRPCEQVFVVGEIQEDGTVRGGTGWGAELARRWNKELHVFDQVKERWFQWNGDQWAPSEPRIAAPLFVGTGTSRLKACGQKAIEQLFDRSFEG